MTSKAALCIHLLKGEVVNIGTGFRLLGITNIPREIGRSVERAFGVVVSRSHQEGKSRYNVPCTWVNYRLNKSEHNQPGIAKMIEYIKECMKDDKENIPTKKINQPVLF
jgi:hypothetical protein